MNSKEIFIAIRTMVFGPNKMNKPFLYGVEATCIGFAIFDKKQAEVMQLSTLKKASKRRERRNGTSPRARLS